MTSFAQIPTNLICRFGELTKTEIIVLGYLYAKRNTKTGQCNPSKAAIGSQGSVRIGYGESAFYGGVLELFRKRLGLVAALESLKDRIEGLVDDAR